MNPSFDVVGLDVGQDTHHLVALDRAGTTILSRTVPNHEPALRELLAKVQQGTVLLVVDQPATVGALPVAVARELGMVVAYLPGLAMRRMADVFPGEAKTDARDAQVIAVTAQTSPHTLRRIEITDETIASLTMLCGFDADLVKQGTATKNRIRGVLTQIHPALERVVGPRLDHKGVPDLLVKWPTPARLQAAGPRRIATFLRRQGSRRAEVLAEAIGAALSEQTVVVPGTDAVAQVMPHLADHLLLVQRQRAAVAQELEALVAAHPLSSVLTSLPGFGVRTTATYLVTTAGKSFATAAHLAAYAGIAPVTRRSGSSVRGEYASHRGNKPLKQALDQSAMSCLLHHPESRAYYDRKRSQGKRHSQALLALTRRRIDVIFAMVRDGTPYQTRHIATISP